jgi:hypothetical protein
LQCALIANKKALIIDTRLNPVCLWSSLWTRAGLRSRYGNRSIWRGDLLGNKNYRETCAEIELADETQGISWLVCGLEKGYTLMLLCGCSAYDRCHRKVIYEKTKQVLGNKLPEYALNQRVLTPCGVGRIDPSIPLDVHRARNRYAVKLDMPSTRRYFFPNELEPFNVVQASLIA